VEIRILDVGHGFCAWAYSDNGKSMLIDCGHNAETNLYPSDYLIDNGCTRINSFFVTNYDEDHISGLPRLRSFANVLPIDVLYRNPSITPSQLRELKRESGPLGPGMNTLLNMLTEYVDFEGPRRNPPDFGSLTARLFWNLYPAYEDTNNLSLVIFLSYPGMSIVFPGDLESAGWQNCLKNQAFRECLANVNVFVASHHGRASGYEADVFEVCHPEIILISDESIQYGTQEEIDYAAHAKGVRWATGETRYVLTTRNDGMIAIKADGLGSVRILTAAG